jgi:alpha-tubulin suppressor-like RCC1 family protein
MRSLSRFIGCLAALFIGAVLVAHGAQGSRAFIVAWGDNDFGEVDVPVNETNVIALSRTLAARANGTVFTWGWKEQPPSDLTNVQAVSASINLGMALKKDGSVSVWGIPEVTNVPPNLLPAIQICAGGAHWLMLLNDGGVVQSESFRFQPPPDLGIVRSIGVGTSHCLAVKADGSVAA